jgi:hypothetical protein
LEVTAVDCRGLDDVVGVCFEVSEFERAVISLFSLIIAPLDFLASMALNDADVTEDGGVPDRWGLSVVMGSSKEAIVKAVRIDITEA